MLYVWKETPNRQGRWFLEGYVGGVFGKEGGYSRCDPAMDKADRISAEQLDDLQSLEVPKHPIHQFQYGVVRSMLIEQTSQELRCQRKDAELVLAPLFEGSGFVKFLTAKVSITKERTKTEVQRRSTDLLGNLLVEDQCLGSVEKPCEHKFEPKRYIPSKCPKCQVQNFYLLPAFVSHSTDWLIQRSLSGLRTRASPTGTSMLLLMRHLEWGGVPL